MNLLLTRSKLRRVFVRNEQKLVNFTFEMMLGMSIIVSFILFPSWVHMGPLISVPIISSIKTVPVIAVNGSISLSEFNATNGHSYYDYTGIKRAFNHRTSLHYLTQFERQELPKTVLAVLPKKLQKRAGHLLPYFFYFSQKYKIDPYWAISIGWTESHFNFKAKSYVGADGIMQIMPKTKEYLLGLLRYSPQHKGNEVITNIHLGIYYLSKLLKQFGGNYVEATVAYNMGPGWVNRWKARRRVVGSSTNEYLNKVKRYYGKVSVAHYHMVKGCDYEYLSTYVVRKRNVPREKQPTSYNSFALSFAPLYSNIN